MNSHGSLFIYPILVWLFDAFMTIFNIYYIPILLIMQIIFIYMDKFNKVILKGNALIKIFVSIRALFLFNFI